MVLEKKPVTDSMTVTAKLGETQDQWIYFRDPKPEGDAYYQVDRTGGEIPSGMRFLWGEVDHPRFVGIPTAAGTYTSSWRIVYYGGRVCNHTVTVQIPERDPIYASQTVPMTDGKLPGAGGIPAQHLLGRIRCHHGPRRERRRHLPPGRLQGPVLL